MKNYLARVFIFLVQFLITLLLPLLKFARTIFSNQLGVKKNSFWTGAPILTIPLKARAESLLGFQTKTVVRNAYYITNTFDYVIQQHGGGKFWKENLLLYKFFLIILLKANRLHAFADGGLLPSSKAHMFSKFELFCYNVLGIQLFIWTYGADIRTKDVTKRLGDYNCCTFCPAEKSLCICDTSKATQNYKNVSKVARAIFSMGDMIEYTPGSINDLFFWPVDIHTLSSKFVVPYYPNPNNGRPLRIVHAPNHRAFKGSDFLIQAVSELNNEGHNIELVLVENIPNHEALKLYKTADLIFDQCLIGFHGYFALEAMALGKPVMCFIRDAKKYLLDYEECPLINVEPLTLKNKILDFATTKRPDLQNIGIASRQYIEKHYSVESFSKRLSLAYKKLGAELCQKKL